MKLTKVQEKKLQEIFRTLKDNVIDTLINDGIFDEVSKEILNKKSLTTKELNEMAEKIIDGLFK